MEMETQSNQANDEARGRIGLGVRQASHLQATYSLSHPGTHLLTRSVKSLTHSLTHTHTHIPASHSLTQVV
jgi:hypothetical protein